MANIITGGSGGIEYIKWDMNGMGGPHQSQHTHTPLLSFIYLPPTSLAHTHKV